MQIGYHWKPIEDLPEDWRKLASSELAGLLEVWKERLEDLKDSAAYREFQARLRREWAIETGIIEGLYDIDRGVTRTLIEQGLHASLIAHGDANKPAEEIIPMLKDHESVIEGLFDFVGRKRQLSTSYIKQVHQALTTHQETAAGIDSFGHTTQTQLLRGEWKKWPNNPTRKDGDIHEYCPPEQTASEMDRLIEMHQRHLEVGIPPEVEAAWLHHRFTQIHPFQDGNGRVARALASLIFIRSQWFPFVVHRDDRTEYLDALENADTGDLTPLVSFTGRGQKNALNQALNLSTNVLLPANSAEEIISAGARYLQEKEKGNRLLAEKQEILRAQFIEIADLLRDITQKRLDAIANQLDQITSGTNGGPLFSVLVNPGGQIRQLVMSPHTHNRLEIAEYLGVNSDAWSAGWECFLNIGGNIRDLRIHISMFQLTQLDWRVACGVAYLVRQANPHPHPLCTEAFQYSTSEKIEFIISRYRQWLEDALTLGLEQWRRQL